LIHFYKRNEIFQNFIFKSLEESIAA